MNSLTPEQYRNLKERGMIEEKGVKKARHVDSEPKTPQSAIEPSNKSKAFGRKRHVPGTMTKLELAYSIHLTEREKRGEIIWFAYEAMKFKLADKTYYTPDFIVLTAAHFLEAHECKGHWRMFQNDSGRIKIKVAAERFWWLDFVGVMKEPAKRGGGWKFEKF